MKDNTVRLMVNKGSKEDQDDEKRNLKIALSLDLDPLKECRQNLFQQAWFGLVGFECKQYK